MNNYLLDNYELLMLISILKFLILCYDRLYEGHKVFVSFYEL